MKSDGEMLTVERCADKRISKAFEIVLNFAEEFIATMS